jgi:hypothetical protein
VLCVGAMKAIARQNVCSLPNRVATAERLRSWVCNVASRPDHCGVSNDRLPLPDSSSRPRLSYAYFVAGVLIEPDGLPMDTSRAKSFEFARANVAQFVAELEWEQSTHEPCLACPGANPGQSPSLAQQETRRDPLTRTVNLLARTLSSLRYALVR